MEQELTKLYEPFSKRMNVIGFMSSHGSVLRKIIEKEDGYKIVAIFTDNYKSNARKIGKDFDIPVITRDIKSYCHKREVGLCNMNVRKSFDLETCKILKCFNAPVLVYAGYMSLITEPLIARFLNVNIHPSDLTILDEEGNRKYTGRNAVGDAMKFGEEFIKSTVHIINKEVDNGPILAISDPVEVDYNKDVKYNQDRLKKYGDFKILPEVLQYLSEGKYSKDFLDNLYFNNSSITF
jgi:folate-dependent phosphoribosylglycinamide formyltransferase PurN